VADTYGFDREGAEKIARVVRQALASSSGEKSHRRADVSGPGNHVAVAKIVEAGGNTHKFIFVAGEYDEEVGTNTPTFQEVAGEYFAHDLCGDTLAVGDKVWIVDHNNQWWIIDRCTDATGSGTGDGCCGSCGGGSVTTCDKCNDGGSRLGGTNAQNAWSFDLGIWGGEMPDDAGCCEQLAGSHFVYHSSGCVWKGIDLDHCNQHGASPAYPYWKLEIHELTAFNVILSVDLDEDGDGTAESKVEYWNPYPWCCDCANPMVLKCPVDLPTGCDLFPCEICLLPGPKCCATSDLDTELTATITNTSGCACADARTVTLVYRAATQDWFGSGTFCDGHEVDLTLSCDVDGGGCSDFRLEVSFQDACNSGGTFQPNATSCSCDPLSLPFEGLAVDGCCGVASTGATVTITITE